MKNNFQTRNKSKYLTNIGFRFLLLCILLTSHLPKISAEDGFMLLQSTDVTLNLTNVSLETLFKTLEKKSNYVFFFKEDVLQKNEKVTVKAQNESHLKWSWLNTERRSPGPSAMVPVVGSKSP